MPRRVLRSDLYAAWGLPRIAKRFRLVQSRSPGSLLQRAQVLDECPRNFARISEVCLSSRRLLGRPRSEVRQQRLVVGGLPACGLYGNVIRLSPCSISPGLMWTKPSTCSINLSPKSAFSLRRSKVVIPSPPRRARNPSERCLAPLDMTCHPCR